VSEWQCPKGDCDLGIDGHDFALVIEHIYGGVPTKSGRNFDAEESREVADRVAQRLWGDE
jgi:hypothetical protein